MNFAGQNILTAKMMSEEGITFYLTLLAVFACGLVASAGGIGGGGVIVPILLILTDYSFHKCTVLSLCAVFGSYVAQSFLNWSKSHPFIPRRPLINWDLVLILLPAQLGGSHVGVLLAKASPDTILLSIALLIMIFVVYKTSWKAIKLWRQEQSREVNRSIYKSLINYAEQIEGSRCAGAATDSRPYDCSTFVPAQTSSNQSMEYRFTNSIDTTANISPFNGSRLLLSQSNRNNSNAATITGYSVDFPSTNALRATFGSVTLQEGSLLGSEPTEEGDELSLPTDTAPETPIVISRELPRDTLIALVAVWLVYVAVFATATETLPQCSVGFFALLGAIYPPLIFFLYWAIGCAAERQVLDPCMHLAPGDIDLTKRPILPSASAFVVGVLSALLGIGGGELMGPLLLSLHLLPPVSVATTGTISLLNSANTLVRYVLLGTPDHPINYTLTRSNGMSVLCVICRRCSVG